MQFKSTSKIILIAIVLFSLVLFMSPQRSFAQGLPKISLGIEKSSNRGDLSVTLQIVLLITILSLAPAIVMMVTSFTRIVVVFSFLRHAIGTQQMPPNQLLIAMALILTFFVMAPVINQINTDAVQPYLKGTISQDDAYKLGVKPLREFMLRQTREKDLTLFVDLAKIPTPNTSDDIPTYVLIPGFMISELRIAFQISFVLFIPFLIIDMVVASVLMSMGMLMLPPVMISMPFKILLFVLVDGWYLIVKSLVTSFH
ncbi:MAG TPA: flagellar type III secretion system pore protein FliP [candidate division Zixibacteria bacterium]